MKIGQRLLSIAANSRNGLVPFERTRTQTIFWGGLPISPQADFGEISLNLSGRTAQKSDDRCVPGSQQIAQFDRTDAKAVGRYGDP